MLKAKTRYIFMDENQKMIDRLHNAIIENAELSCSPMFNIASEAQDRMSKEIDRCALHYFNIPKFVLQRKWLLNIYSKIYKLEIEQHYTPVNLSYKYRFIKAGKKVGESEITLNFSSKGYDIK